MHIHIHTHDHVCASVHIHIWWPYMVALYGGLIWLPDMVASLGGLMVVLGDGLISASRQNQVSLYEPASPASSRPASPGQGWQGKQRKQRKTMNNKAKTMKKQEQPKTHCFFNGFGKFVHKNH